MGCDLRLLVRNQWVWDVELVDIECVKVTYQGSRFCPYKSAILDFAYIVFRTKNPGAS